MRAESCTVAEDQRTFCFFHLLRLMKDRASEALDTFVKAIFRSSDYGSVRRYTEQTLEKTERSWHHLSVRVGTILAYESAHVDGCLMMYCIPRRENFFRVLLHR